MCKRERAKGFEQMSVRKTALVVLLLVSCFSACAGPTWQHATVIKISTLNAWCRQCPDWNQTLYSFKLQDGMVYVARTHRALDITLHGTVSFRVEKDGHVGDHAHVLDDAGKDRRLVITEKKSLQHRQIKTNE